MDSRLTPLQSALLDRFFAHETRFVLTGGGALAGFHLGHRSTKDLDLFTQEASIRDGDRALEMASRDLGASVEKLNTSVEFARRLVRGHNESVLVDLVVETAKRENPPLRVGSISVEAPEEILANKICTLLARSEIRDLVDAYVLERSGLSIEGALPLAHRKDGGVSPAQLAWVLSQIAIPDGSRIPGDTPPAELRTYLADLQRRLLTMAWPQPTP